MPVILSVLVIVICIFNLNYIYSSFSERKRADKKEAVQQNVCEERGFNGTKQIDGKNFCYKVNGNDVDLLSVDEVK